MKLVVQIEHRASSSRGKHEGESSYGLCDRLSRTRDNSQRQLPTDHDYAVPTREYQTDQSSLKTAPTAARSVLGRWRKQIPKQPHHCAELTRSLHIRPMHVSSHRPAPGKTLRFDSANISQWQNGPDFRLSRTSMVQPSQRYFIAPARRQHRVPEREMCTHQQTAVVNPRLN